MSGKADWTMVGWREAEGAYVLCASSDLMHGQIHKERDEDYAKHLPGVRLHMFTDHYAFELKARTYHLVRGPSYADCLVKLMELTDFDPDKWRGWESTAVIVDEVVADVKALDVAP